MIVYYKIVINNLI